VRYLIKMVVNDEDKAQIQDLCSDTKLNNHLSQKFKLIRKNEFNHLIYILAEMRSIIFTKFELLSTYQIRSSFSFFCSFSVCNHFKCCGHHEKAVLHSK
jgi:hypothetical protein